MNYTLFQGHSIERKGDLAAVLTNLTPRDVLFIDEIHRIHIGIEEILYSAMEDFRLDILIGQGASARTMEIKIPPFTLVGATTKSGLLSNPLRDRFMAHFHFDFYEAEELSHIIKNNARKITSISYRRSCCFRNFKTLKRNTSNCQSNPTTGEGLLIGEEKNQLFPLAMFKNP